MRIHGIAVGGSPVTEYGSSSIIDPDAVVVDQTGGVASPGSVIVGGQVSNGAGGMISQIFTNQSVSTLVGPTPVFHNPTDLLLDATFATGLGPSGAMTIGALGGGAPEVYAVGVSGELLRIDLGGTATVIGTGFSMTTDLEFGLAGELYVSEHGNDRVLCIAPGPVSYCAAGTSASGCQATLSTTGTPSASAPTGFDVLASSGEGNKSGILFFATNGRQASSWGNGTRACSASCLP